MTTYGLLIDYEYCTGCGSCEVACKEEHAYPVGKWGIRVLEDGPWEIEDGTYNWNHVPVPTDLCDLCSDRTDKGREPFCVHHCLANVMKYGPVEVLAAAMNNKTKQVLFVPQFKPLEAKGEFVPKNKFEENRRRAAAVDVAANEAFEIGTHRGDARVHFENE